MREIPPPPIPDGLTEEEGQAFLQIQGHAHNLKHSIPAAYIYATISKICGETVSCEAFREYLNKIHEEAGQSSDPIERMLIEQITLAHHNIGRLTARAAAASTPEHDAVYSTSAARLLAEFRRAVLALKKYREPTPSRNVTLVKHQNVAQNQQIAFVEGDTASKCENAYQSAGNPNCLNTKLASKEALQYVPERNPIPQSPAGRSRKEEPVEAARPHR